jgi:hypothetical protein
MSRSRITRRRAKRNRITTMDGREIGPMQAERRKTDVLAQGGVFIDIDQRTGTARFSFSPEAEERITKDAAAMGLNFETYMRQVWQEHVDRELAKERAEKQP